MSNVVYPVLVFGDLHTRSSGGLIHTKADHFCDVRPVRYFNDVLATI